MAKTPISLLLLRRLTLTSQNPKPPPLSLFLYNLCLKPYSTTTAAANPPSDATKPSSLSARMSFVFDQIDAIERERAQKHQTLQKIRAWRQSKDTPQQQNPETITTQNPEIVQVQNPERIEPQKEELEYGFGEDGDSSIDLKESDLIELKKKEVELVHPWPEWIELMERLVQQNYFDHRRKAGDKLVESLGLDVQRVGNDDDGDGVEIDFNDFRTVQVACLNFGKDRFDIMRSLSRQDLQILVGYGCPNVDNKVVFSSKLLRKHVHLDEGDVCSNCSLRSLCERGYLLTNKEDEAQTIDVMRVLLAYGFDSLNGSVVNKSLLKQKSVKNVVRKLLHEVVRLSAVPIDPNLSPPVIKKPPPKVKQPPPPPKRRVGRDDVEMKKGDWLCPKCDFMNFAKNTACLQCDAKRPKRQLLPGEWECPECNFLNYRRNMACFHCDCKRPPDAFVENKMEERQQNSRRMLEKIPSRPEFSNAWNFDFDDNESDGVDVAAFEYADPAAMGKNSPLGSQAQEGNFRGHEDDLIGARRNSRVHETEYSDPDHDGYGRGFNDFDDEDDIDSYELDTQNNKPAWKASQNNISEQGISYSEDDNSDTQLRTTPPSYTKPSKRKHQRAGFSVSEEDELDTGSDEEFSAHPKWKSSHVADARQKNRNRGRTGPSKRLSFGSDEELELDSDVDDGFFPSHRNQRRWGSGRRKFEGNSDLEDVSFSGSDSDNKNRRNQRHISKGNKMESGRRGNKFGGRDYDFMRDKGMRSNGKMGDRRKSWDDFDRSSPPETRGNRRGFQGTHRTGQMGNRRRSWDDDFDRSSPGPRGKNRGFPGNDRAGWKVDDADGGSRNFKGPKREGFRKQGRGRSHEYGMDMDPGEPRNSRRVIER